jgi:hypothetical protein
MKPKHNKTARELMIGAIKQVEHGGKYQKAYQWRKPQPPRGAK